jgi:hypothetical protein
MAMKKQDVISIKLDDKIKIRKMWQSDFGASWPVYEVRIINKKTNSNILLCKCEADESNDENSGLKKAELIRESLNSFVKAGKNA